MTNIVGMNAELICATLDDRERKLITGDSLGQIIVYNCLTGIALKTFPTLPYAVRQLIYSEDKTIIALAGQGDIFIFDELPNDADAEVNLRDVRGIDIDVVSMAYYYHLGLIATADVMGSVMIYNYCDLSLVAIIKNVTKGAADIGQIAFLEPFPLLLVTDSMNNFVIIPVGPAADVHGRKLWRVDSIVAFDPTAVVKNQEDQEDEAEELNASALLKVKPFTNKKKHHYLLSKRDAKCITVHFDGPQYLLHHHSKHVIWEDEPDEVIIERINKLLEEVENITKAREKKNTKSPNVDTFTDDFLSNDEKFKEKSPSHNLAKLYIPLNLAQGPGSPLESKINSAINTRRSSRIYENQPLSKPLTRPNSASKDTSSMLSHYPQSISTYSICGYDDGSIAVSDLTSALRNINVGILSTHDHIDTKAHYDPRKIIQRQIKEAEIASALW
jgi:hypothetical protein